MSAVEFKVTTSVTRRLKAIMTAIAVFFLLSAGAIFISNLEALNNLQRINSSNLILNYITQSIEGLDTSEKNLEKLQVTKNVNDVRFSFNESQKILKNILHQSIEASLPEGEVRKQLLRSLDSILLYESSVNNLFLMYKKLPLKKTKAQLDELNAEILTANQFAMDSREGLRKAQIALRNNTDSLFSSIYENRFRPLLVGISLSGLFFLFVVTFGFSISERINASVRNLKEAAEKVSAGDLSYQAPVLSNDEFGLLTGTFNDMVSSIKEGRNALDVTLNRIRRLQGITAGFSEAVTVDEVIDITVKEGLEALDSISGGVGLVTPDRKLIEIKKYKGYEPDQMENWTKFSLDIPTPMADAIKNKSPVFLESIENYYEKYPHFNDVNNPIQGAMAVIPLIIRDVAIGALNFDFSAPQDFDQEEKDFITAIGRQCSQALHRARLFDETKGAIKIRDEFLSIASHELKTPLTPLKLQLQLIERQINSGEELKTEKLSKFLTNSDKHINRLSKLIEDLLDVSRISSGKFNLKFERVNLSKLVKEVLEQYEKQLKESIPDIEVKVDEQLESNCDPVRIEQVLINLLTNAAKYAPGKPVQVTVRRVEKNAQISVKDFGPGIEKEHQKRIFQRFERVKSPENITGLGLGLFISNQIIEAHKGKIYVESESGKGSEFIIELPVLN